MPNWLKSALQTNFRELSKASATELDAPAQPATLFKPPQLTLATAAYFANETYRNDLKVPSDTPFVKIGDLGGNSTVGGVMTNLTDTIADLAGIEVAAPSYNIKLPKGGNTAGTQLPQFTPSDEVRRKAEWLSVAAATRYSPETGELVISYRGSLPVAPANWIADIKLAMFQSTKSGDIAARYALELVNDLKKQGLPVSRIYTTGHSLGGYLAAVAGGELSNALRAQKSSIPVDVIGFDAPGLSKEGWDKYPDLDAVNISAPFDPVNTGGFPFEQSFTLGVPGKVPTNFKEWLLRPVQQHMIGQILKDMELRPATANLLASKAGNQTAMSIAAMASLSAEDYQKMPPEIQKILAEGSPAEIVDAVNTFKQHQSLV